MRHFITVLILSAATIVSWCSQAIGQDVSINVDPILGPQSHQALGEQRVLTVAVRFPDEQPRFPLRLIKRKVIMGLDRYVREQSYGMTWLNTDFKGWVAMPEPLAKYKISHSAYKIDKNKVRKFIEDAMTAVEEEVDFSQYDHLLIVAGTSFKGVGTSLGTPCYCANPGLLSSIGRGRHPRYAKVTSRGGQTFAGGIIMGVENAHLGLYAHDLFHAFGGIHNNIRLIP